MKSVQKRGLALSGSKGFTLIELLVVIAIIGLLASIVLASLNSARKKSRDARRLADLKQLQNALELYANDNSGNYPSSAETAAATGQNVATYLTTKLVSTYIAAMPGDPLAGSNTYVYRTVATFVADNSTSYCLGAAVEGTPPTPATTCGSTTNLIGVTQGVSNITYAVGNS